MIKKFAWVPVLAFCLFYAPLAGEYFFSYCFPNHHWALWDRYFVRTTSAEYAHGKGSYHEFFLECLKIWPMDKWVMLCHSFFGSIALLGHAIQFVTPLRKNYLDAHRLIGKIAFGAQFFNLCGSAIHLSVLGPNMFSGPAFWLTLWALWLVSVTAMSASLLYIRYWKNVEMHWQWSALSFTTMLTAPGLRYIWTVIYHLHPGASLVDLHHPSISITFIGLSPPLFLFWSFSSDRPSYQPIGGPGKLFCAVTIAWGWIMGLAPLLQDWYGLFATNQQWWTFAPQLTAPVPALHGLDGLVTAATILGWSLAFLLAPFYTWSLFTNHTARQGWLWHSYFLSCLVGSVGAIFFIPHILCARYDIALGWCWALLVLNQWVFFVVQWRLDIHQQAARHKEWAAYGFANLCGLPTLYTLWAVMERYFDSHVGMRTGAMLTLFPMVVVYVVLMYVPRIKQAEKKA